MSRRWPAVAARRASLVVIAALVTAMMFVAGQRLRMVESVHARHAFYSIPYAISRLYFGATGYVILRDVADPLISAYPRITDAQIHAALHVTPNRDRLMYFPADEKGDADFVTLAFLLFGARIDSLYATWFVLFSGSVALFVTSFWRSPPRMALLALVLLAAYTAFFALPLTTELATVQNPRVFGLVSLVAVLHLSFLIIDGRSFMWSAAVAIAQAALIVFSVYVRSTELWQVLCVIAVAVFAGSRRGFSLRLARAWPVALLALGLVALEAYQLQAFDPAYRSTQIRHRIVWHNIGIGFALNPVLAEKYGLSVDDAPMIRLVRQRLLETGRVAEVDAVFMPPGSDARYYGIARDYVRYERVAREVVLDIVRHDTWQALKTFIVYKPIVLWRQLAWATGFGQYSIGALHLEGQAEAVASEPLRRSRGLYLDLLRLDLWVGLLSVVAIGVWRPSETLTSRDLALACWTAAASLVPNMIVYPIFHTIGLGLVTTTFALLTLAVWLLSRAAQRLFSWAAPLEADEQSPAPRPTPGIGTAPLGHSRDVRHE